LFFFLQVSGSGVLAVAKSQDSINIGENKAWSELFWANVLVTEVRGSLSPSNGECKSVVTVATNQEALCVLSI